MRRAGTEDYAQPGDLWHIGSCTKAMTATLIALQVEKGKMRWDMRVAEVLPEMRDAIAAGPPRDLPAHRDPWTPAGARGRGRGGRDPGPQDHAVRVRVARGDTVLEVAVPRRGLGVVRERHTQRDGTRGGGTGDEEGSAVEFDAGHGKSNDQPPES